jgi:hypothetical protein
MRQSHLNAVAEAASSNAAKVLAAFVIGMVAVFAGALMYSGSQQTLHSAGAANVPAARHISGPAQQPAPATPNLSAVQKSTAEQDPQQQATAAIAIKPWGTTQIGEVRGEKGKLQAPRQIEVPNVETFEWFDAITGKPRVWFAVGADGSYKFFDHTGMNPQNGRSLQPITPEIVTRLIHAQRKSRSTQTQVLEASQSLGQSLRSNPVDSPQRFPVESTSEQTVAQPAMQGAASQTSLPADIVQLLMDWQNATIARDPVRVAACYMPSVDIYFTKTDVDREQVRIIQERLFAKYAQIVRYQISDIQLQPSAGDTASVIFRKSWDFRGIHTFFGSERERLVLKHAGSRWKISSEQELQILQAIYR